MVVKTDIAGELGRALRTEAALQGLSMAELVRQYLRDGLEGAKARRDRARKRGEALLRRLEFVRTLGGTP